MKTKITVLLAIVVLASCSTPKYSYFFEHRDYNAGKKKASSQELVKVTSPLAVDAQSLEASITNEPTILPVTASEGTPTVSKTYAQMNKSERMAVRHYLKKEIKSYVKGKKKSVGVSQAKGGIDHDLKLAAIFGAVGIVGLIIGGDVFYIIGAIALLIGVVFFVKWLIRQ